MVVPNLQLRHRALYRRLTSCTGRQKSSELHPEIARCPLQPPSDAIAAAFEGQTTPNRRKRVGEVIETLVSTGVARSTEFGGEQRYFLPR